jgi:hypothetical protein
VLVAQQRVDGAPGEDGQRRGVQRDAEVRGAGAQGVGALAQGAAAGGGDEVLGAADVRL